VDVRTFLDELKHRATYQGQIVHERKIPPRQPVYSDLQPPLSPLMSEALEKQGITRLYRHQVKAITAIREGHHTVVVTSTASGKTLCYNLPVLETLHRDPAARAIYVFPTKALAQDQADALAEFGMADIRVGTYDGDTPTTDRQRLRKDAKIILTNPDMLHVGILPQHARWTALFEHLRYVVIDDVHIYRGVFGSNVANILRRLRRVCRMYGSDPVFICTSATIANPEEFARTLLGLPVTIVDADGAPRGPKWVVLWNPPLIDQARARRRSAYSEASALFARLIRQGVRTIVFTPSRKITELVYRNARTELTKDAPQLAGRISPYRAGYLPQERRAIERRLFSGDLLGVVSTSALELGIDVGTLEAAILVGYPGTIASLWQRAGRAGRGTDEALVTLVALEDALDQYLMQNPAYLFGRSCEHAVIDPENPFILTRHLRCAAAEAGLWEKDVALFGDRTLEIAALLADHGDLVKRRDRWYWVRKSYPATELEIRSASGETFRIIEGTEGRLVGTVDAARAFEQVHPGATYLHHGDSYLVKELDLQARTATVEPTEGEYYTQPRSTTDLAIVQAHRQRLWGPTTAYFGDVDVTTQVTSFVRKRSFSEEVLRETPLDLPAQRLQTTALWFPIPHGLSEEVRRHQRDLAGGIHALEHAAIGILPLLAMCDRWDLGGVSYPFYPELDAPAIFIYEGHPGGVGITDKGFALLDELMAATLQVIDTCSCEDGCPSCIQSPKCGNLNEPLDKAAAIILLRGLLEQRAPRRSVTTRQPAASPTHVGGARSARRRPRHRRKS